MSPIENVPYLGLQGGSEAPSDVLACEVASSVWSGQGLSLLLLLITCTSKLSDHVVTFLSEYVSLILILLYFKIKSGYLFIRPRTTS